MECGLMLQSYGSSLFVKELILGFPVCKCFFYCIQILYAHSFIMGWIRIICKKYRKMVNSMLISHSICTFCFQFFTNSITFDEYLSNFIWDNNNIYFDSASWTSEGCLFNYMCYFALVLTGCTLNKLIILWFISQSMLYEDGLLILLCSLIQWISSMLTLRKVPSLTIAAVHPALTIAAVPPNLTKAVANPRLKQVSIIELNYNIGSAVAQW